MPAHAHGRTPTHDVESHMTYGHNMLNTTQTNTKVEKGDGGGLQKKCATEESVCCCKEIGLERELSSSPNWATGGLLCIAGSFWCPLPAAHLPPWVAGDGSSITPPAALLAVAPPGSCVAPPLLEASLRETRHLAVPARTPSPPKPLRLFED